MQEIKCPKCGEVFQIDEAGYAEIVKQVRNQEFNAELQRQKQTMDNEKKMAVELAVSKANSQKDDEISKLKNQLAAQSNELNNMKDKSAAELMISFNSPNKARSLLKKALVNAEISSVNVADKKVSLNLVEVRNGTIAEVTEAMGCKIFGDMCTVAVMYPKSDGSYGFGAVRFTYISGATILESFAVAVIGDVASATPTFTSNLLKVDVHLAYNLDEAASTDSTYMTAIMHADNKQTFFSGMTEPASGNGYKTNTSYGYSDTGFCLGGYGKNDRTYLLVGTLKNFRQYNHALTAEEVVQNRKVDNWRYFGIPDVTNVIVQSTVPYLRGDEPDGPYAVDGSHTFSAPASATAIARFPTISTR